MRRIIFVVVLTLLACISLPSRIHAQATFDCWCDGAGCQACSVNTSTNQCSSPADPVAFCLARNGDFASCEGRYPCAAAGGATATPAPSSTPIPGGPTSTPRPTNTPYPTNTPTPTPGVNLCNNLSLVCTEFSTGCVSGCAVPQGQVPTACRTNYGSGGMCCYSTCPTGMSPCPGGWCYYAAPATTPTPAPPPLRWYDPTYEEYVNNVIGDIKDPTVPNDTNDQKYFSGTRYTFAQLSWVIQSLAVIFRDGLHPDSIGQMRKLFSQDSNLSAADVIASVPVFLFTHPPASGIHETERALALFDVTPVSAQGYGYASSLGLLPLWSAMRNLAILTSVLFMLVLGFMIMFRVRVNRQPINILSILPKIITTLIGIVFSYAIAGFVIDFTYLLVAFFVSALSVGGSVISNLDAAINFFVTPGYYEKLFAFYLAPYIALLVGTLLLVTIIPIAGVFGTIILILMILITLILLLRVWWMLVKNYVMLIFLILLGPWQILLGLVSESSNPRKPSNLGLYGWLRSIIAHCAVFAVVPILFLINVAFWQFPLQIPILAQLGDLIGTVYTQIAAGITPIGNSSGSLPSFPMFAGQGTIWALFSSWIILAMIPKTADMVKDALKVSKFGYDRAFGEALAAGGMFGAASSVSRGVGSFITPFSPKIGSALSSAGASGGRLEKFGERLSSFKP